MHSVLIVCGCCSVPHPPTCCCRNYLAEDEDAPFDGSLLAADKRCFAAFQARYGRGLSRALYTQLLLCGAPQDEGEGGEAEVEVEFY